MEKSLRNRYYSCFFTGHRIIGSDSLKEKLFDMLLDKIEYYTEHYGVETFICGGAIGFDTLAARAVIKSKEKYPYIKLIVYIPCYDHSAKWSWEDKAMWKYIMCYADSAEYVTKGTYERNCMRKRNMKMAADAHYCIAFCVNSKSGTGMTVRYANDSSCNICNLADELNNGICQ